MNRRKLLRAAVDDFKMEKPSSGIKRQTIPSVETYESLLFRWRTWAIDEMKWKERLIPPVDIMKRISTGQMNDIWRYVVNNVYPTETVNKIRCNVKLTEQLDGITIEKTQNTLRKMLSKQKSNLEASQIALQLAEEEVRHMADLVVEKDHETLTITESASALDANTAMLEILVNSHNETVASAYKRLSLQKEQKDSFLFSSVANSQRSNPKHESVIKDAQKLQHAVSKVYGGSDELRDKAQYAKLMDRLFSMYHVEEIMLAVFAVGECKCQDLANLDSQVKANDFSAMAQAERKLRKFTRAHRNEIFYRILEQENIANKADTMTKRSLKTLNEKDLVNARINLAAETKTTQCLEKVIFSIRNCGNMCSEVSKLLQESKEAVVSLDYSQKYRSVSKLIPCVSKALGRLESKKSEVKTVSDVAEFDVPVGTINAVKSWQSDDSVFKKWNAKMLQNPGTLWTHNLVEECSKLGMNPYAYGAEIGELEQELELSLQFLEYFKAVVCTDNITAMNNNLKYVQQNIVEDNSLKTKTFLPKLNEGIKLSEGCIAASRKLELHLTYWWENPVHKFELDRQEFGLTFQQWRMRWLQALDQL